MREWRHKTLGNGVLICGFTSGRDNILLRARNSMVLLTFAEVTRSGNYCWDSGSYRYHWVRGYLNYSRFVLSALTATGEKKCAKLAIPFFMAKFALLEAIERTFTNYFRAIVSLI